MDGAGGTVQMQGSVPLSLTRFFGREREISELREMTERARLVTLIGSPGSGKTRLAIEWVSGETPHLPGGVRWVELAPVSADQLASALARTLRIHDRPGRPLEDTLAECLAVMHDPPLLVLDNCEHLIEAAAGLVDRLLASCPELRILATSRAPLGLAGEQVYNVRQLDPDSACQLFADRATLASGGLTEAMDDAVVESICAQLDRLPLAIELAAASARMLSLRQIADRLARVVPLPPGPSGARPGRHRTMSATVDWSYRLLPPAAQELFPQLSVFAGSFDFEAAQAVAARDVLEPLTALVDHSLVTTVPIDDGSVRYRLLEPIRQHGQALLDADGQMDTIRRRHAEHYLELVNRLQPLMDRWGATVHVRTIKRDAHNLRGALEWARNQGSEIGLRLCVAMAPFWLDEGQINEGQRLLTEELVASAAGPELRARALVLSAHLRWRQGEYGPAHQALDQAQALTRDLDDNEIAVAALNMQANILFSEGDGHGAVRAGEESLELAERCGLVVRAAYARLSLAWAHLVAGDLAAAEAQARTVLAEHGDGGEGGNAFVAGAYVVLQYGAFLAGDPAAQRAYLLEALTTWTDGTYLDRSYWLASAAALAATEGRPRTALRVLGGAIALGRRHDTQPPEALRLPFAALFERVYDQLGRPLADRLVAQGEGMSWDELVALTLAGPGDEPLLTPREYEVATLVAEGLTNVEIARKLSISRRTVESHIEHIRRKLGFRSRQQIIAWVLQGSPEPQLL